MKSGYLQFSRLTLTALSLTLLCQTGVSAQEVIQLPDSLQGLGLPNNQLVLPRIHNNPVVPTDTTGIGGSLGLSKGLRGQLEGPEVRDAVVDVRAVKPDERYTFIGRWSPMVSQQVAVVPRPTSVGPNGQELVAMRLVDYGATYEKGTVEKVVPVSTDVFFMPTTGGKFYRISDNEVMLESGATLVRADKRTVLVSAMAGDKKVTTQISPGTMAMVSLFDNRVSVVNLMSKNDDGVISALPDGLGKNVELNVLQGTQTEIHPGDAVGATGHLVAAGRPPIHNVLPDGATIRIVGLDYTKTMKTYNLQQALPEEDFEKLLKVAAANTIVLRTRAGL